MSCICGAPAKATVHKGLCRRCYMKQRGERLGPCAVAGCESHAHARGLCNTCYQWTFRRGAVDFINEWKLQGCVDCPPGRAWLPVQVDADHVGGKTANVSRLLHGANSKTLARIKAELANCEPRCRNHHRQVTHVTRSTTGRPVSRHKMTYRQRAVLDFKAGREWRCTDCLERFDPAEGWTAGVLELDHMPGFQKVDGIARMVRNRGYTLEQLVTELAKTELVCACCHALRTASRDDRMGYARSAA